MSGSKVAGDSAVSPELRPISFAGRELMEFDIDQSWPFDPNPFLSLLCSSPSQIPASPLWVFSDEIPTGNSLSGEFRLPPASAAEQHPTFRLCSSGEAFGNLMEDDSKPKLLPKTKTDDGNTDVSSVIKERMMQALRYFKESTEQHVLVQVWAPVKNGGRYMLTTSGQPFVLDPHSTGLLKYRTVSLMYMFSVDGESDSDLGLPGRVFRQKLPEWTPNVQFYTSKEYCRLDHALHYDVRGTLALPVFEPSGQSCIGVVELIMTAQKINYALDVDKVCRALEAVNLKSSEILDFPNMRICNEGRQAALAEILEILTVVCESHKLPLAQTWVPCRHRSVLAFGGGSKKSCTSFDGSCMGKVCMSTSDVAFYVIDAQMWGFRDACAEHHLQKDQGVAGMAYASHRSCFSGDVTQFSKTEYPLVHYARMFGLRSCLAICLRSEHTGSDDYILEFFFPPDCMDSREQQCLLESLSATMKRCFRSLKVVAEIELQQEKPIEIIEVPTIQKSDALVPLDRSPSHAFQYEVLPQMSPGINDKVFNKLQQAEMVTDMSEPHPSREDAPTSKIRINIAEQSFDSVSFPQKGSSKTSERKRGKAEKSISLEVLQQYFAGSLKDAAKSLGVCPTTMKRICRQHGISRWPSRKINKVNRSLSKLKRVIESVQGTEGAFDLVSLTSPIPAEVGPLSWPINLVGHKEEPENELHDLQLEDKRESPESDDHGENQNTIVKNCTLSAHHELIHDRSGLLVDIAKATCQSRNGSGEDSTELSNFHDSCHAKAANGTLKRNFSLSSIQGNMNISSPMGVTTVPIEETSIPAAYSAPETTHRRTLISGHLMEGSGSCKDFRDVGSPIISGSAECGWDDPMYYRPDHQGSLACATPTPPPVSATQDVKSLTIKASYKEDIVRFRLLSTSAVLDLNEEVARRFKLEIGTFDIKYLDDDNEWVLMACDADLQECIDISKLSGGNIIRLLVHDIVPNFGSSCESSGK